ncbi:MAG: DUF1214 domain-containing protein [Deltaproteobacteria bacterium]|nr:DUF1214 domain-containing protein [Deltaproteobacteria bacterium]
MSESRTDPPELAAWRAFCRRMETLGEEILQPPYPATPADGPEAIAHLADQVACWLGFVTGHSDPTAPFFHRSNDLVTQWGGPNQDNAYRHARIDPKRRYRIRGKMHSCEEFALTLRVDFMHMPEWGTRASITASDRGIGPGDEFEILLGGDGSDPDFFPIPEDVTTVSLREYYIDWQPAEPAVFTIECLDEMDPPARIDGPQVAARLVRALSLTERSITYWNDYMLEHRAKGVDNEFALPMKLAKGFSSARYAFCFFELAPDEALYIESDVPDARYWGLQLANLGWFEQIDPVNRITTINQHQAHIDGDGRLRMVVAHEDPGVANWLDTGGHHDGLLTFRWFWPQSDPSPATRVVKRSEVADLMPADAPSVSTEARRAEIGARKAHLAWRFRT